MRLDKFLADQGAGTRREIREAARRGLIFVNGEMVRAAERRIDPLRDEVAFSGRVIPFQQHVYYMMNKPAGVLSAARDPKQPTVLDLLPDILRRPGLFPAGRLDKDTEGFLLITDDGGFAHDILSPKKHVLKTYFVKADGPVAAEDLAAFREGVLLADGTRCLPAETEVPDPQHPEQVLLSIREGKYHQIKRMFACREKTVIYLKRLAIGEVFLDDSLKPGECRPLTPEEIGGIAKKP